MKILTRDQSARYHKKGYCAAEGLVDSTWLARLNAVTHDFIEESRGVTALSLASQLLSTSPSAEQ